MDRAWYPTRIKKGESIDSEFYQFRLGSFICTAVCDGRHSYSPPKFPPPADFLFTYAPRQEIKQAFQRHILRNEEWSTWTSQFNCLLIDTGEHRVLVDTGADGFGPDTGKLLKNLVASGASPNSIDYVIITHAHPDHIGGCTDDAGLPVFSQAKHVISKAEWEFWRSGRAEKEIREFNREVLLDTEYKNLPAIRNQLLIVEGETDLVSGIRILPAPGHTPGQIAVLVFSKDRRMLFISDIVFHPVQVEYPHWSGIADLDPAITVAARDYFFQKAVRENMLVMGFHFPFPGLGWVIKHQNSFVWLPHIVHTQKPSWALKQ